MAAIVHSPWYAPLLRLRWRLAVVSSALFAIFVVILSIVLYGFTSNLLLSQARAALPAQARALRTQLVEEVCSNTSPQPFASFLHQNNPIDIDQSFLLDKSGIVVASSDSSLLDQPFPYLSPAFFTTAPDNVKQGFPTSSINNSTTSGFLLSIQPTSACLSPLKLPAYLAIITSFNEEQSTLRTILLMLALTSTFMIILGALIISFFTGIMFQPLHQVTRATRALAHGNLGQRVPPVQSQNEIAELTESFNQMADQIQSMVTALQDAEKRAQRFVSAASHELRTPITSLRGFTEVLLRGAREDPATLEHVLGLMKIETERMTDLVSDLLALARLDDGVIPTSGVVDLMDLVIECQQEVRKQSISPYKLSLELASDEPLTIFANREQVKQLLLVLLSNAVNYGCSEEQPGVLIRLSKIASDAQLQVIDYGEGIPPADLPHIFERFYRGRNATERSAPIPGTGLGLSLAQAIAQAYQGSLTVTSQPGEETIFTATFPAYEAITGNDR